jgi:hypothetical protein
LQRYSVARISVFWAGAIRQDRLVAIGHKSLWFKYLD